MANTSAESNFRSNLSQFRWARGVTDDSQPLGTQAQAGNSRNPFSRFYNAVGGAYVPLRSNERSNEEEAYFALSRWERFGARVLSPRGVPLSYLSIADCWAFSRASQAPRFALQLLSSPFRYSLSVRRSSRSHLGMCMLALPVSPHGSCVSSRCSLGSLLVMFG
jgi:hypothetical protein